MPIKKVRTPTARKTPEIITTISNTFVGIKPPHKFNFYKNNRTNKAFSQHLWTIEMGVYCMHNMKEQERKKRMRLLLKKLQELFPRARVMLRHKNTWELLVAVMLSAQCTDKKVNEVTQQLFKKYKTVRAYAQAPIKELERDIFQTGFYHTKAKHIQETAQIILKKYKGKVPSTMEELLSLPGVAHKTANIVLGNAFGIVEGIAVDTHVRRFALKFGLTQHKNTDKIEQDLMKLIPQKDWLKASYQIIEYGRNICPARKHACENHSLSKIYPLAAHTWPKTV